MSLCIPLKYLTYSQYNYNKIEYSRKGVLKLHGIMINPIIPKEKDQFEILTKHYSLGILFNFCANVLDNYKNNCVHTHDFI